MITREEIRRRREEIISLAGRHGASNVRIFGSVARGDATPSSDVDLLVRFEPGRSLLDHGRLIDDLEDLLGTKVDVVSEGGLRDRLRDRVMKEVVPRMRGDRLRLQDILDAVAVIDRLSSTRSSQPMNPSRSDRLSNRVG